MSFYAIIMTWLLLCVSITQYVVYENWNAAMYFLVSAGFFAVWNTTKSAVSYTNCNFVFTQDEDKNNKQE